MGEEAVLEGITSVLPGVTICGGSAASAVAGDQANGNVFVVGGGRVLPAPAIAVALLWPSRPYAHYMSCMHAPNQGDYTVVTRVSENGRRVHELGGQSAAQVYKEFCADLGAPEGPLTQFARVVVAEDGTTHYFPIFIEPDSVSDDGSMRARSAVREGDELVLVNATLETVLKASQDNFEQARNNAMKVGQNVAGAFVMWDSSFNATLLEDNLLDKCAGLLYEQLVIDECAPALHGLATCGEQGPLVLPSESCHANQMIHILLFCNFDRGLCPSTEAEAL